MIDCGVLEHDVDCVCDVIITEPTPVRCGIDDHWVLSMVAKHLDIDLFNSRENFGLLLEKCDEFLAVYLDEKKNHPPSIFYKKVREKAESIVIERQGGVLPSEVRDALGLDDAEFLECMTYGKPKGMTVERMDKIVKMRQSGMSHYKMCNILGIKNKNKQMGLAGWLSRIFVDPYVKVEE